MAKGLPDFLLTLYFLLTCIFQQTSQIDIQTNFFDKVGKFSQETGRCLTARFEKIQQRRDKAATHSIDTLQVKFLLTVNGKISPQLGCTFNLSKAKVLFKVIQLLLTQAAIQACF